MSTDKYIFPQVVAPWMEAAKPTPEQVRELIRDWTNYAIKSGELLREQAARIAELEAQLAVTQKDAARYRWLRKTTNWVSSGKEGERIDVRNCPEAWDSIIDAAIAGEAT